MHSPANHTIDFQQQRLRIASDVRVWPVRERGELVYRIEIPSLHRFFRIGYRESYLCSLLDGQTTLGQACSIAAARLGRDAPTSSETVEIAKWLLHNDIAHLADSPPPPRDERSGPSRAGTQESSPIVKFLKRFNPFWMTVPVPRGHRIVGVLSRCLAPFLSMPAVVVGCLLIVSAACVVASQPEIFLAQLPEVFHPTRWAWILCTWLVLKIVHELGHAVACHRLGGEVHRCGVVFVLLAPLAYVDVTSCWRMPSRWSRIAVSAAGMFVECCVASIATWCFILSDDPWVRDLSYSILVTAGVSTLLFNANVLMRFDGYYILADAVDIPNLAAEASTTLRRFTKRWIVGESRTAGQMAGWRGTLVSVYATASLLWRVSVCVGLLITASTLFHGGGVIIAAVGIVCWSGSAGGKLYRYLVELRRDDPIRFCRAIVLGGGAIASLIAALFFVPIPSRIRTPVMTRFAATASVRAPANGIVESVEVRDGQRVDAATPLVTLRNEELVSTLKELEIESQRIELEWMRASHEQNEGRCQVLRRNADLLDKRIDPIRRRVESLHIRSERAGVVVARELESLVGTYVNEGDEIMIVAGPNDREWITLIEPQQIETIRSGIGNRVRLTSPGHDRFASSIRRIEPRATDRLSEPALASINGGSMSTQSSDDAEDAEHSRLLQPHFYAWLDVDTVANQLPVGIRMQADCGYRTQTIASRLSQWVRALYEQQK